MSPKPFGVSISTMSKPLSVKGREDPGIQEYQKTNFNEINKKLEDLKGASVNFETHKLHQTIQYTTKYVRVHHRRRNHGIRYSLK